MATALLQIAAVTPDREFSEQLQGLANQLGA